MPEEGSGQHYKIGRDRNRIRCLCVRLFPSEFSSSTICDCQNQITLLQFSGLWLHDWACEKSSGNHKHISSKVTMCMAAVCTYPLSWTAAAAWLLLFEMCTFETASEAELPHTSVAGAGGQDINCSIRFKMTPWVQGGHCYLCVWNVLLKLIYMCAHK